MATRKGLGVTPQVPGRATRPGAGVARPAPLELSPITQRLRGASDVLAKRVEKQAFAVQTARGREAQLAKSQQPQFITEEDGTVRFARGQVAQRGGGIFNPFAAAFDQAAMGQYALTVEAQTSAQLIEMSKDPKFFNDPAAYNEAAQALIQDVSVNTTDIDQTGTISNEVIPRLTAVKESMFKQQARDSVNFRNRRMQEATVQGLRQTKANYRDALIAESNPGLHEAFVGVYRDRIDQAIADGRMSEQEGNAEWRRINDDLADELTFGMVKRINETFPGGTVDEVINRVLATRQVFENVNNGLYYEDNQRRNAKMEDLLGKVNVSEGMGLLRAIWNNIEPGGDVTQLSPNPDGPFGGFAGPAGSQEAIRLAESIIVLDPDKRQEATTLLTSILSAEGMWTIAGGEENIADTVKALKLFERNLLKLGFGGQAKAISGLSTRLSDELRTNYASPNPMNIVKSKIFRGGPSILDASDQLAGDFIAQNQERYGDLDPTQVRLVKAILSGDVAAQILSNQQNRVAKKGGTNQNTLFMADQDLLDFSNKINANFSAISAAAEEDLDGKNENALRAMELIMTFNSMTSGANPDLGVNAFNKLGDDGAFYKGVALMAGVDPRLANTLLLQGADGKRFKDSDLGIKDPASAKERRENFLLQSDVAAKLKALGGGSNSLAALKESMRNIYRSNAKDSDNPAADGLSGMRRFIDNIPEPVAITDRVSVFLPRGEDNEVAQKALRKVLDLHEPGGIWGEPSFVKWADANGGIEFVSRNVWPVRQPGGVYEYRITVNGNETPLLYPPGHKKEGARVTSEVRRAAALGTQLEAVEARQLSLTTGVAQATGVAEFRAFYTSEGRRGTGLRMPGFGDKFLPLDEIQAVVGERISELEEAIERRTQPVSR